MSLDWSSDPWEQEERPRRRSFAEALAAPVGWAFNCWVAALLALVLVASAPPGGMVLPLLGLGALLSCFGLVWLIRLCAYGAVRPADGRGGPSRGFVVAPILVVASAAMFWLAIPTRVGFELSRTQFQRRADEVLTTSGNGGDDWSSGDRVGLFGVRSVSSDGNGVRFQTGGFFLGEAGFAYSPDGEPFPGRPYGADVIALGGGWWAYSVEWD